jgi:hypothetical protein
MKVSSQGDTRGFIVKTLEKNSYEGKDFFNNFYNKTMREGEKKKGGGGNSKHIHFCYI